jgi:hypothetical protein
MKLTAIVSISIFATAIFAAPKTSHGRARALKQRSKLSTNAAEDNEETDNWAGAVLKAPPTGDSFVDVTTCAYYPISSFAFQDILQRLEICPTGIFRSHVLVLAV